MRYETKFIVVHCSATRPSQDIGVKEIDRWHRERGFIKVGYATIIKRNGEIERGRDDDEDIGMLFGFNSQSVAEINNKMVDDVKIILAEYRLALKKNDSLFNE